MVSRSTAHRTGSTYSFAYFLFGIHGLLLCVHRIMPMQISLKEHTMQANLAYVKNTLRVVYQSAPMNIHWTTSREDDGFTSRGQHSTHLNIIRAAFLKQHAPPLKATASLNFGVIHSGARKVISSQHGFINLTGLAKPVYTR